MTLKMLKKKMLKKSPKLLQAYLNWTGLSSKRLIDFVVTLLLSLNNLKIDSSTLMVTFFGCLASLGLELERELMPSTKPQNSLSKLSLWPNLSGDLEWPRLAKITWKTPLQKAWLVTPVLTAHPLMRGWIVMENGNAGLLKISLMDLALLSIS